jgi:hypothetical protein
MSKVPNYAQQGYRITSRKHGIISRIDREDWLEFLLEHYPNWRGKNGGLNTSMITELQAADHYRRVFSKDTLEIGKEALRLKIPNSGDRL